MSLINRKAILARERLRRRYRPTPVRLLFVGEAPPASGRFFYQADSGLYRAVRDAFVMAFPIISETDFLESFHAMDCYLVDLCGRPVDRLTSRQRKQACVGGELRLGKMLMQLQPRVIVTVVRSIAGNVRRARQRVSWAGTLLELPYPGRWHRHRVAFLDALVPVLLSELDMSGIRVEDPDGELRPGVTAQKIRRSAIT